eukprot:93121_1
MFTMSHIYLILAIIQINSVTSTPCCKLASTKACFNAMDRELSTIFNAPVSGTIIGIKLVHESGSVYCNGAGYTNWGCEYFGQGMLTYLEKVVEMGNDLGYPTGEKYYPTSETNDITSEYDYGWSQVYKMSTFDIYSEQVLFINPKYTVTQSDQFMLQYSEADGESRGDNAGTACASVYFVYDSESVGQCDFDCTTILPYETDKMCISESSMETLNGEYEWNSWDNDITGSKYYKSSYNKYLYPYITTGGSLRYYINSDGYGTMVNAYCEINNAPSNYIFNVEDCIGSWYIATENDGFVQDPNMISTNCQELCIKGDYRNNLDGTYIWHHFNPIISSSVYECESCQSYLFLWKFDDGELNWRIGPDYSDAGAWTSCHLEEIDGVHHPELCDSSNWGCWYDDTWNDNIISVEKCDITTTTTTTTTTTKKAISYDSGRANNYDDDSDDSDVSLILIAVFVPIGFILLIILISICAKTNSKHDEPVAIYNHNSNHIQTQVTEPVQITPNSNNPDVIHSEPGMCKPIPTAQTEGFSNINECQKLDINNIDMNIKQNDINIAENEVVKTVVEKVVDVVVDEAVDEVVGEVINVVVEEIFDGVAEAVIEVVADQAAEVVKEEIKNQVVSSVFGFLF